MTRSSGLMLRCTLASRGSSRSLHASGFRHRVDGLSAFDEALPRFQAWHHSEMSIEWVPLVRSLSSPFRHSRSVHVAALGIRYI